MAYDFRKEMKALYQPKDEPGLIEVPAANYLAVRGSGDPNEPDGAYQQAIAKLYAVAYTLRMSPKSGHAIPGFQEYVVPPLEGFWWLDGIHGMDYRRKSELNWISVIRLPDFITPADHEWAVREVLRKKKLDCTAVEFLTVNEGLCVQVMHHGAFDDEPETVARMDAYLVAHGYVHDFSDTRLHHEIYLSDTRKVEPSQYRTVIRHPVKREQEPEG